MTNESPTQASLEWGTPEHRFWVYRRRFGNWPTAIRSCSVNSSRVSGMLESYASPAGICRGLWLACWPLLSPMLDLGFVRDHLAFVEQKLRERGDNPDEVLKDFHQIDHERRAAITQVERLKEQRNHLTEEIARLKKAKQDASEQIEKTRQMREQLPPLEKQVEEAEARLRAILTTIPNIPHEKSSVGVSRRSSASSPNRIGSSAKLWACSTWSGRRS